jgi:hypothetical protein
MAGCYKIVGGVMVELIRLDACGLCRRGCRWRGGVGRG